MQYLRLIPIGTRVGAAKEPYEACQCIGSDLPRKDAKSYPLSDVTVYTRIQDPEV